MTYDSERAGSPVWSRWHRPGLTVAAFHIRELVDGDRPGWDRASFNPKARCRELMNEPDAGGALWATRRIPHGKAVEAIDAGC